MTTTKQELINGQLVKVTVLPAAMPSRKKPRSKYVTLKEKDAKLATRIKKQATLSSHFAIDAYDLSAHFNIEQRTITESEFLHANSRDHKLTKTRKPRLNDFDI